MPELTVDFQSLPDEYQRVLRLAQDTYNITVAPLQLLVGGWSGAVVYLVSVASNETQRLEHCILKLDRKGKAATADEVTRHNTVLSQSTPAFARQHIADLAFESVEQDGAMAIFYRIAGQSLLQYRPLSRYERQSQLKTIFRQTNTVLLSEWNPRATFEQAVHPQKLLQKWLGFRLEPGGSIERFLQETCRVDPAAAGLLIHGHVFPNPLLYARQPERWGPVRAMDVATGFLHGDLNTNNILVRFANDKESLDGYYLIDFALFKDQMPLLYDQRYLEMSYLMQVMAQVPFPKAVSFLTSIAETDDCDPQKVPIEMSGVGEVILAARDAFAIWIQENHPSLYDDLRGQYWLAGVAAGLSYCHKHAISEEGRLAGLIYAAANLKRYATTFGLPLPTNVELLYDETQVGIEKPLKAPRKILPEQTLPSGTVTFLFTDIEGSTRLSQQYPEEMPALLARHHEILDRAVSAHNGFTFQIVADSYSVAFHSAGEALETALEIQRALNREAWSPAPIRVRMGIHTGAAQLEDPSKSPRYSGYTTVAMAQRIMSAAHGGQVLLSPITADLIRDKPPADAQIRDMGEWRLKDITQPVHLYQFTVPDLPAEFPALNATEVANHNLPAQLTPFIGRESELAALQALLSDGRNRLITIMAPGGMGKTRLSLETAGQMVPAFPQGIYFVALDRISSAESIVQSVAEVLPIFLASNEDPKSRILEYLRDKTVLLVMDNFEHVLDGTAFVQDLLQAAPGAQILVTSRARLNLTGETVFQIEGLSVGEGSSATQLFAQSARRTQPAFALNETVLPAVTKICALVEGMPLAIVLAAAWTDTLSLDEIATEVEVSLDMLATEKRNLPDRQRSVRAVIEASWGQVDSSAQDLLKRLSVFRGGFTRQAAQDAAGASLRGLSQLVDKALLRRDPDRGRYSIHELLRQYAEEQLRLSAEEERSAHENHATYFADFMKTREEHLHDHRGKTALLEMEADFDNIRIAWNYWTDRQDARRLLAFTEALWIFFEVRSSYMPAIQLFDGAAQRLVSSDLQIVCARAQIWARQAWFTALIGRPEEGLRMAQESVSILRQYDQDINIQTLQGVSINAIFLNKIETLAPITQEIMARAERSGDRFERAWALIWQGYTLILQNQIGEALQVAGEVYAMSEMLDNPLISWWLEASLGYCSLAVGDMEGVKTHFSRAAQRAEAIHWLRMLQISYEMLGRLAIMENDVEHARQFSLQCLRISQECGQTREMLASLRDLASMEIIQGNLEQALKFLAVVLNHPASQQNLLNRPERLHDEAETLRLQIEMQLEPSRYHAAWEIGQKQRLVEVVTQILK